MEPCQFAHYLQARRLKALANDLSQYSPDRIQAFQDMIEKQYLSVDEIATELDVNPETVRRWIRLGKLKSVKAGRQHRIKPEDLEAFLAGTGSQSEAPDS